MSLQDDFRTYHTGRVANFKHWVFRGGVILSGHFSGSYTAIVPASVYLCVWTITFEEDDF